MTNGVGRSRAVRYNRVLLYLKIYNLAFALRRVLWHLLSLAVCSKILVIKDYKPNLIQSNIN